MSILRIYFSSQWRDSTSVSPWALCDDSGAILQSGMGTLASMPEATQCVGVLSADRVLFVSARTPPGARRKWRRALPYLVEGRTLPDPDENHVVLCDSPDAGSVNLAITDKAWLRRIVDGCRAAGRPLRSALSELQLLPCTAPGWTVAWDGIRGFVRTGDASGVALDVVGDDGPPIIFRLMLENSALARPKNILVRPMAAASGADAAMPCWQDLAIPLVPAEPWDWRRASLQGHAVNLLTGALAPPSRPMEWWPKLRPALVIMLLLILVEMAGSNLQWAMLAHEERTLHQQMDASFRKAFGNDVALVNAPLQMQRNIADLRHEAGVPDGGDFLSLMDVSAGALAKLPPGSVRELYFEGARLKLVVNVSSLKDLDALQRALRSAGLHVQAETSGGASGLSAQLTLRQQGAQ